MVEEWVKDARNDAKAEAHSRSEIEKTVGSLKETKAKLSEQLKEAIRVRDSSDTGLKNTEKQAKEQRKQLHFTEINLATEKQLVKDLHEELQKVRLRKQPRPRSRQHIRLGWRRLKSDSQRNSLWYAGSIVVYLGVKPLMLLGSLRILT